MEILGNSIELQLFAKVETYFGYPFGSRQTLSFQQKSIHAELVSIMNEVYWLEHYFPLCE